MDLFGRFRKLDSSLQRGLDNGFARVFGGEVVPAEIDELLKQEAEDALMEDRAGTVHAPSVFEVHVAVHDYETLLSSRPNLDQELRDRLNRFIRNEGWTVSAPVSVDLIKDDGMHTGQLRCRSSFPTAQQRGSTTGPSAASASPRNKSAAPGQRNSQRNSSLGIASQDADSAESSAPEWPRSEPHSGRNPVARPYNADSSDGDPASSSTGTANPISPTNSGNSAPSAAAPVGSVGPTDNPTSSTSSTSSTSAAASSAAPEAAAHAAGAGALAGLARPHRQPTGWGHPVQTPEVTAHGGHGGHDVRDGQAPTPIPDPASTSDPHPVPAATREPGPTPETEVVTGPSAEIVNGVDGLHTTGSGGYQAAPHRTVTLQLRDGSDRTYVLKTGSNTIGRGNQVDFRLPDTGVSRRHGDITWDGFDAVLTDLHSTNGTTVNEIPVENWLLADGDVIAMGHSEIEVHFR